MIIIQSAVEMFCCCLWEGAQLRVEEVFFFGPRGKQRGSVTRGLRHLVRPGVMFNTSRNSPRPAPPHRPAWPLRWSAAGAFGFGFISRPGTVAISDSCILAFRWLWPLFISDFFLCVCVFFHWISSCFFQIQCTAKRAGILSQSFLDLLKVRSQLFKIKQGGRRGLYQEFMCVWTRVHRTDASEIPKQYKAWCVGIRQKPVESGEEMSAATTTAAIQLETDNTFAQRYARTLFKSR